MTEYTKCPYCTEMRDHDGALVYKMHEKELSVNLCGEDVIIAVICKECKEKDPLNRGDYPRHPLNRKKS